MKRVVLVCLSFALALGCPNLGRAASVDLTDGYWRVSGEDASWTWQADLVFESQVESYPNLFELAGYFDWTSSGGQFGRETFTGTLYPDRAMDLVGESLVEPHSGISLSSYYGMVAADGEQIVDGFWPRYGMHDGTWSATHVDGSPVHAALYSTQTGSGNAFYEVNPMTGGTSHISDLNVPCNGLAISDSADILYASHAGGLATLNRSTGELVTIGGPAYEGLAFDRESGKLYGSTDSYCCEINIANGNPLAVLPAPTGFWANLEALACGNGILYGLTSQDIKRAGGELLAYDIAAKQWSLIGDTGLTGMDDPGLAFDTDSNLLYCSRAGDTNLYAINPATAEIVTVVDMGRDGAGGLAMEPIPEPATTLLLSFGGLAWLLAGSYRRRVSRRF